MSKTASKVILIGKDLRKMTSFEQKLGMAGYTPAIVEAESELELPVLDPRPEVAVFLPLIDREPRTRIARALRQKYPSIKIVMLYEDKISGAEVADAVIHARCSTEDLGKTLHYLCEMASSSARRA